MPLPSGLQARWVAEGQSYSDNATMSSGWTDSSGNARTATLQNGTPKWRSGASGVGPNGKACVSFNGSSNFLVPNFFSAYTEGEIFVYMKNASDPTTGSPASPIGSWGTSGSTDHTPFTDGIIYDGWGSTVRKTTINPVANTALWTLYNVRSKSGLWINALNGERLWGTLTNTVGFSTAGLIGKSVSNYFLGDVAEIQFYDHVLSNTDRSTVVSGFATDYVGSIIIPTTYKAHWSQSSNVTVNDTTGSVTKSGGSGGSYDASAKVEQIFDGQHQLTINATIGTNSTEAFGIYAHTTSYTPGSVTTASLLAAWEVTGGTAVVKESGTTKFTQGSISVGDKLTIRLTTDGTLFYAYNDTEVFISAIAVGTVRGWRPWRIISTMNAASSQFSAVEFDGATSEYYDPDTPSNNVVQTDDTDLVEYTLSITQDVHVPSGGGTTIPLSRAWIT